MNQPSPQEDHEWRRLMMAAQTGEAKSYAELMGAVTPFLRSVALGRLGKGRNAERAAQLALVTIHGQRHAYDPSGPIAPWLRDITEAEARSFSPRGAR